MGVILLFIESAIAFILIMGILVFFHELGHYLAAKAVGVPVEVFAFGFGPRLVTLFKRGGTEYNIHAIPLGGFVKLTGMEPGEEHITDGFQAQPIWKRAVVIFAGPFASFVLAVLVFICMGAFFGFPDGNKPLNRIGMVSPDTEAARIGLRSGDRIVEIEGKKISNGREMIEIIHNNPGKQLNLVIKRDDKIVEISGTPRWTIDFAGAMWSFPKGKSGLVGGVAPDTAAKKAGLREDDVLRSINGKQILGGQEMVDALRGIGGKPVVIEIVRGKRVKKLELNADILYVKAFGTQWLFPGGYVYTDDIKLDPNTPAAKAGVQLGDLLVSLNGKKIKTGREMLDTLQSVGAKADVRVMRDDETLNLTIPAGREMDIESGYYMAQGIFGFTPEPSVVKAGLMESVARGLATTVRGAVMVVTTLFSDRVGKEVGGPIMIAKMTQSSVTLGPYWVLSILGSLSLSLAVFNLIPLPILDGGHLMILAIEAIRKKRLTRDQMATIQFAGLVIIVTLMIAVFYSDLSKLISNSLPQ